MPGPVSSVDKQLCSLDIGLCPKGPRSLRMGSEPRTTVDVGPFLDPHTDLSVPAFALTVPSAWNTLPTDLCPSCSRPCMI